MVALAFYKGKGNWIDKAIRFVTRSLYSHVELIAHPDHKNPDGSSICRSSSSRDGGVRKTDIMLDPENWDLVSIDWKTANGSPIAIFHFMDGQGYDYQGIFLNQLLNLRRHRKSKWFCSEICAAALQFPNPASYSPQSLKDLVEYHNQRFCSSGEKTQA